MVNPYPISVGMPISAPSGALQGEGSMGAILGDYSLVIPTYPSGGSRSAAIKRVTWVEEWANLQFEMWFTWGSRNLESDQRRIGVEFDIQTPVARRWFSFMWYNYGAGAYKRKWQYNNVGIDPVEAAYVDIPGANQRLPWNTNMKWNWCYFRGNLNLLTGYYIEMQCQDQVFDMGALFPSDVAVAPELQWMLNILLESSTDSNIQSVLYVDSCLLSAQ